MSTGRTTQYFFCVVLYAHPGVPNFEMHLLPTNVLLLYLNTWCQVYRTGYMCRGVVAVAPDAYHPTLTRTLWHDLCLDAVACKVLSIG